MTSVGDVVAQLRDVIERLDKIAVAASRVQADAKQAHASLAEVGQGTDHRQIREAITESRAAEEKAGKAARLFSEAARHFSAYTNIIAPGSVRLRKVDDAAMPSGEQIMREAEDSGNNVDRFVRRHVKKLDGTEGSLQKTETAATVGLKKLFKTYKGQPGSAGTTTPAQQPTPIDRPQVEHPGTAVVIVAGAAAVRIRRLWSSTKKRRERKARDNQT